jgi:hypothetical protein
MLTTFVEVLGTSKSDPGMAIHWTPARVPGAGVVEIQQRRASTKYAIAELLTGWDGHGFRFFKVEAESGTDKTEDAYDVFCARNGQDTRCDCKGFERWGSCKHLWTVQVLIENDWLRGDLVNPEQDTASTECPF